MLGDEIKKLFIFASFQFLLLESFCFTSKIKHETVFWHKSSNSIIIHADKNGWILISNETPDKTLPGFHLKCNMFFISDQILYSFLLFRLRRPVKKRGIRASSLIPNTYGLVLSFVFRCLEPVSRVMSTYLSFWHITSNTSKFVIHCCMVFLPLKHLASHYCWGVGVTSN